MEQNKLNVKQICSVFLAVTPLVKIVTAPAVFSSYCNEKLWQPFLILLAFDLAFFCVIFAIATKNPSKTFFQILCENYSPSFAKTIMFFYALFFLARSFLPIIEQKEFIENAFYETLPQAPVFYPVFAVTFYLCLKGIKSLGRVSQLLVISSGVGIFLILFLSLLTGNFFSLFPIFAFSSKSAPICALNGLSWFNDSIYLLFFIGGFKPSKKNKRCIILSFLFSSFIILFFFLTFYSIFSYIAPTQKLALNSMSIFGVTLVNVGRFDYIALFLLALSSVVSISLPIVIATQCLKDCFSIKNSLFPALVLCLIVCILTALFSTKYQNVLAFITSYLTPAYIFFGFIAPFLAFGGKKIELQKG